MRQFNAKLMHITRILSIIITTIFFPLTYAIGAEDTTPPTANHNRDDDFSIVDMTTESELLFRVNYSDKESGIDATSVRIFINDVDVTNKATVTHNYVSYVISKNDGGGLYSAKVIVKDKAGNATTITWDSMYQHC